MKAVPRRGGALLIVLWLTAALSAIAFSVANTVRGETERTSTAVDELRGRHLAAGAIERTLLYILWGPSHKNEDGSTRFWENGISRLDLRFPGGDTRVEIIPANSRLNVNSASGEDLYRLLLALEVEPTRAEEITDAILDWRRPRRGLSIFDRHYMSLTPSFLARHASFEETEEVLLVKGMTPEIFYGSYTRDRDGRLVRRGGFRDCVSVYGSTSTFDVNTADPALLVSVGVAPSVVNEIVRRREIQPFRNGGEFDQLRRFAGDGAGRLRLGGTAIYTIRATARPRLQNGQLSDMRRSVAATVRIQRPGVRPPYRILRWYDSAPVEFSSWQ